MRDKRTVDELSVEELERILAIKKREARQQRLQRMQRDGRVLERLERDEPPMPIIPVNTPADGAFLEGGNGVPEAMSIDDIKAQLRLAAAPPAPEEDGLVVPVTEVPVTPMVQEEANSSAIEQAEAPEPAVMFEDERRMEAAIEYVPVRRKTATQRLFSRALWLVEIAAVLSILLIGANLLISIQKLDAETASAQAMAEEQRRLGVPTLAPTPSLRLEDAVLPGGHVFTEDGGVQFNYDEVPSHLASLVESQWIRPVYSRPPVTNETALTISIPTIEINQAIVQGVDWEALKQGVGQLANGANPGDEASNVVFAAHNDVYGEVFRYLDELEPGDEFQLQTASTVYTYVVTETLFVEPTNVSVLEPRGRATATLISCWPYQVNDQRVVVYADRVG